ncbi:MAG: sigma 54-interacting transcriptional regulator, partial [Clostridia bacterium]|nr:sigma 54-interacting transcriptional regulator [Clostridia bacterium]
MTYPDLFSPDNIQHIREMRKKFFKTGSTAGITGVRPEILNFWDAYYKITKNPDKTEKQKVSKEDFSRAVESSKVLLSIAVPYMVLLHSFLQQEEGFFISLMDPNGVIIKLVGNPRILEEAKLSGFFESSFRGEGSYPGLFNISWKLDKPFQIISSENPSSLDDNLAGAAAPIHDIHTKKLLGVIGISGYWWNSHSHTLGLVILAAEAISQQLALRQNNAEIASINSSLDMALEAIDSGIVYFNEKGMIKAVNRNAIEMLDSKTTGMTEFKNQSFFSHFQDDSINSIEHIRSIIESNGSYTTNAIPIGKHDSLHCIIRNVANQKNEYIAQIQKSSVFSKSIAKEAFINPLFTFDDIIGNAPILHKAKCMAQIAARHSPTILITGESGTGKEMFAQAIHNSSSRSGGPFIAINCGAIPKSLLESELFGYEAGAFTGAKRGGHPGKFELANNGTIFLDEIGDMPYETQISLLRVLEIKQFTRIGGTKPITVDVTIIAATNQELTTKIAEKSFREDLYYRLNVFNIQLPSLRERINDISLLCEYFTEKYSRIFKKNIRKISEEAIRNLENYNWPGNVRELENAIERATILCTTDRIEITDLPESILGSVLATESLPH